MMQKESSREFENEKQKDVKRPYILTLIGLLVLFGLFFWAIHFERPITVPNGNAPSGQSSQTNGSGAGDKGDAQGFG